MTSFTSGNPGAQGGTIPAPDQTPIKPWIFRCPICGGGGYDAIHLDAITPFGKTKTFLYHRCIQCSVLFTDPKKFTDVK